MRRRVEETLDLLGLADAARPLPAGPLRRPAAAGRDRRRARRRSPHPRARRADVGPRPVAAEDVLAALHRLVHDLGITVVLAEHRLERVIHHADRVLLVSDGRTSPLLEPAEAMAHLHGLPAGHRRWAGPPAGRRSRCRCGTPAAARRAARRRLAGASCRPPSPAARGRRRVGARAAGCVVRRGPVTALRGVDLDLARGSVTALMGRNGAGKSTLLAALAGSLRPSSRPGAGLRPRSRATCRRRELVRLVGLVPQDPSVLLYAESVAAECRDADADFAAAARHDPRAARPGRRAGRGRTCTRATCPRGSACRSRWPSSWPAHRACCCWTSRPAAWTTAAKERLVAGPARSWPRPAPRVVLATHDVELAAEVADARRRPRRR